MARGRRYRGRSSSEKSAAGPVGGGWAGGGRGMARLAGAAGGRGMGQLAGSGGSAAGHDAWQQRQRRSARRLAGAAAARGPPWQGGSCEGSPKAPPPCAVDSGLAAMASTMSSTSACGQWQDRGAQALNMCKARHRRAQACHAPLLAGERGSAKTGWGGRLEGGSVPALGAACSTKTAAGAAWPAAPRTHTLGSGHSAQAAGAAPTSSGCGTHKQRQRAQHPQAAPTSSVHSTHLHHALVCHPPLGLAQRSGGGRGARPREQQPARRLREPRHACSSGGRGCKQAAG